MTTWTDATFHPMEGERRIARLRDLQGKMLNEASSVIQRIIDNPDITDETRKVAQITRIMRIHSQWANRVENDIQRIADSFGISDTGYIQDTLF